MFLRNVIVKALALVFLPPLLCAVALHGQPVINNPAKPLSLNAGRVLKLTEVWRISDEGGGFYFKNPGSLQIAKNGDFFLWDEGQLLKFSPKGLFLGNLGKAGQGPGELSKYFIYFIDGDDLVIQDNNQAKIVRLSADGVFKEQISLKQSYILIGIVNKSLLLFWNDMKTLLEKTESGPQDVTSTIVSLWRDGTRGKNICAFTVRWFRLPRSAISWDPFISILSGGGDLLYVIHTEDYLIKVVDLTKGAILRSFKRDYSRIKCLPMGLKAFDDKRKYKNDIEALYFQGKNLWIATSTVDPKKGHLIDIFDAEGRYLDNFYLKADGLPLTVKDDTLYMSEENKNGSLSIVKYKID